MLQRIDQLNPTLNATCHLAPDEALRSARASEARWQGGLPIGLQLVGPMFGDALVLRAARAYETVRPIARPRLNV